MGSVLKKVVSVLVLFFLFVTALVSVALGVFSVMTIVKGENVTASLHTMLQQTAGNSADWLAKVVLIVVGLGGTIFWLEEMMEPEHNAWLREKLASKLAG